MHGSARRIMSVVAVLLVAGPGCSRKFFRERADKDVEGIISQKNVFPDWTVKNWFVYPHPAARFADPYNPDRPPYPADDPAARLLSPNPQHPTKKTGVGRYDGDGYMRLLQQWDAENRAEDGAARGAQPARVYTRPTRDRAAREIRPRPAYAAAGRARRCTRSQRVGDREAPRDDQLRADRDGRPASQ